MIDVLVLLVFDLTGTLHVARFKETIEEISLPLTRTMDTIVTIIDISPASERIIRILAHALKQDSSGHCALSTHHDRRYWNEIGLQEQVDW